MSNPPFVLWLQGPTSAGKTTLAQAFTHRARSAGLNIIHFDGDEIREIFPNSHGFAPEDRLKVVGALVHLANKCRDAGLNVVVSALTARPDARQMVKSDVAHLVSALITCSLNTCAERDPKGLYWKAQNGEINTLIGVNEPYVPPPDPDIVLDSDHFKPPELVDQLFRYLFPNER